MQHDYIELEFTDVDNTTGKNVILTLRDSRAVRHEILEFQEGIHHHTEIYGEAGTRVRVNMVTIPWHRIREIRYYGEH